MKKTIINDEITRNLDSVRQEVDIINEQVSSMLQSIVELETHWVGESKNNYLDQMNTIMTDMNNITKQYKDLDDKRVLYKKDIHFVD